MCLFLFFIGTTHNGQIENRKLEWNTGSKVGSMANAKHRAGGGNVKVSQIFTKILIRLGMKP